MKQCCLIALMLVLGAAGLLPAQAQESPFPALGAALDSAIARGEAAVARETAHKILEVAAGQTADQLTSQDQYVIGLAHLQIARELLEAALQSGKLSEAQAAAAKAWLDKLAPPQPALIVVGKGEQIKLEDYLVAGKTTIVDFYSEFCPPCRALAPHLEKLVQTRQDTAVVKVDINRPGHQGIDWGSPVAQQFSLRSIPYLRIYGPDKQLQAEGKAALTQVLEWCGLN
ncbi:thioredoxin family protein [bacterium]|nr:thioredoxin family protein [bacterium]